MISTYTRFEPDFETNPWLNEDEQEKSDDPNHADDTFEVEFTSPKPIAVEASTPSSLLKTGNNLQVPSQRLHKSYSQDSISSSVKDVRATFFLSVRQPSNICLGSFSTRSTCFRRQRRGRTYQKASNSSFRYCIAF